PPRPTDAPEVWSPGAVPEAARRFAVRAGMLHPASGPPVADALVLVEGGGPFATRGRPRGVAIPEGTPDLAAAAVTPGLIDPDTVVGVSGRLNIPADQDQSENTDPNQADARILDSFNPDEPLLRFFLSQGVTVIQAMAGPADVIAGQAGIF